MSEQTQEFFRAQTERLADLLDQEPERMTITTGGTLVARYKDHDVRFVAFEIKDREG